MDDGLLQQIAQQRQAEQMVMAMLQNTLQSPAVRKRAETSLVGITKPRESANGGPPERELHVALLNGERWEVTLSPEVQRAIVRALTAEGEQ
jgi:hypothetical protein